MSSTTYKVCSQCGAHMVRRENVMTTSHPSLYIYDCPECGKVEYDINKYPCAVVCSETVDYKAKYEEALERAKRWADGTLQPERTTPQGVCEAIFPELRESEDEKIRKEMIGMINECTNWAHKKEYVKYLEKQKDINCLACDQHLKGYIAGRKATESENQKEPKQEWSEKDEENFKWFDKFFRAESVVAGGRDIPQDKYLWFKSLRPQPKQEWSEDDEKTIDNAYCWLCEYAGSLIQRNYGKSSMLYGIANKLKSLRPQPKWKPSEEQMEEYNYWYRNFIKSGLCSPTSKAVLVLGELLDQLKKLMED